MFLQRVTKFGEQIMNVLDTNFTGINEIFVDENSLDQGTKLAEGNHSLVSWSLTNNKDYNNAKSLTRVKHWQTEVFSEAKTSIYIQAFKGSPIYMSISFYSMLSQDEADEDDSLIAILKRFGLSFSTIENAPIKLEALNIDYLFGTVDEIKFMLKDQYVTRFMRNIFSLVGSSSLLGNPIQLVNSVGTGIKDFLYNPIEGFIDGPIEGGKGIITGTGSLVKNTTKGIFGSVSSIVGSASKGILVLSDD